jgi:inorganic phosphate transporter, PiT family
LNGNTEALLLRYTKVTPLAVEPDRLNDIDAEWFSTEQQAALAALSGRTFEHKWQLADALASRSATWRLHDDTTANKRANKSIKEKLAYLVRVLAVEGGNAR